MSAIRTVNLIWEKKHRGIYPPSAFALDDNGTLALATPRPLEPRAYDFTLHRPDGGVDVRWGFSAETLLKMEVSHSDDCIGMTSDDLYLFRNRTKSRFLTDKHINYIDAALSEDGQRVAAAFSDLAGASFALAYGDISGKLIWLREFESPITVVAISRDGSRVATGAEGGALTLLDAARREVWTFQLDEPVRAVACSVDGDRVAYAAASGAIGLIGGDGARIWESAIRGDVSAMALTGDGSLCALLALPPGESSGAATIYCFQQDGSEGWQHDTERRTAGISLSSNGAYLAVGARDGTISLYGIVPGEQLDGQSAETVGAVIAHSRRLRQAGDPAMACSALRSAMSANPGELALHEEYVQLKQSWQEEAASTGTRLVESGDVRAAIRVFAAVLEEDPLCSQASELLRTARAVRAAQLVEIAEQQEAGSDFAAAELSLREAVAVAPMELREPRRAFGDFLARRSEAADVLAARLQSDGDTEGALNALLAGQNKRPTPERALKIRRLQTDSEFAAGMLAYSAKKYNQAVFQFKKVLRLDKNHAEAKRHLEFARRFAQDTSTDSLQDRFSRLE